MIFLKMDRAIPSFEMTVGSAAVPIAGNCSVPPFQNGGSSQPPFEIGVVMLPPFEMAALVQFW
jgi:hypothetical protein